MSNDVNPNGVHSLARPRLFRREGDVRWRVALKKPDGSWTERVGYADREATEQVVQRFITEAWHLIPPVDVESRSYVYILDMGPDRPVKIGISADPWRRVNEMQTAHPFPLRLRLAIPADAAYENALHQKFAHLRIDPRREWFSASSEIDEYVEAVRPIADQRILAAGSELGYEALALMTAGQRDG